MPESIARAQLEGLLADGVQLVDVGWPAISARELFARLTDELPGVDPVVPVVVDDDLLPPAMALVEPTAFVLEYAVASWGPHGPQN